MVQFSDFNDADGREARRLRADIFCIHALSAALKRICGIVRIMWFYFAFFGYACLSIVSILDKFILSKEKVKPSVFVFYSTVFLVPLLLVFPFLSVRPSMFLWLVIVLAAAAFVASLFAIYQAYSKSEVSHSGPFVGGLTPLFILILSQVFLKEQILGQQIFGIFLLSTGTMLISFQKNASKKNTFEGLAWAMASALIFAIFHVGSKYVYSAIGFTSGFIYIWGVMGIFGLLMLSLKEVRKVVFPHHSLLSKIAKKLSAKTKTKLEVATIVSDKALSVVSIISIQYGASIGSVTRVNALSGVQYGLLVLMVAFLSSFFPKIFREKYAKGEMIREFFAVFIIAVGLAFLV